MEVYHFSEEPDIREFVPRPPRAYPHAEPLVYAIDGEHAPLYYFPRDCPRVCLWLLPTTTEEDRERFFGAVTAKRILALESGWLSRLNSTNLFQYTFESALFTNTEDHGVYVTRKTVRPLRVEPMGNLLERLLEANVELRFCPSLVSLAQAVIPTSLHFSLIRMRNAQGWEGTSGTPVAFPFAPTEPFESSLRNASY